jgi:hypothetical protein
MAKKATGKKGPQHHAFKGVPYLNASGYVEIYMPEHPTANQRGYVKEHRIVLENKLGRALAHNEVPHHINHIRNDNRPENLMALTISSHVSLHRRAKRQESAGTTP